MKKPIRTSLFVSLIFSILAMVLVFSSCYTILKNSTVADLYNGPDYEYYDPHPHPPRIRDCTSCHPICHPPHPPPPDPEPAPPSRDTLRPDENKGGDKDKIPGKHFPPSGKK